MSDKEPQYGKVTAEKTELTSPRKWINGSTWNIPRPNKSLDATAPSTEDPNKPSIKPNSR